MPALASRALMVTAMIVTGIANIVVAMAMVQLSNKDLGGGQVGKDWLLRRGDR